MPRIRVFRLPALLSLAGFLVLPGLLSSTPAGAVTPPPIIVPTGADATATWASRWRRPAT